MSSSRSHLYSASGFVSPKGGSWTARRRWIRCGLCAQSWWDSQSWTGLSGVAGGGAFAGDSAAGGSSTRTTAARYRPYWPSYRSSVFSPPWGRGSVSVPALPRPEFYPAQIRKLLVKNYYYWLWSVGPGNVCVQVVCLALFERCTFASIKSACKLHQRKVNKISRPAL